ncbi:MAG: hypothetical protein LBN36_09530 [Clostridiales Family XIII bacterium]|nr:hypothetical protein [Clostridiales Family XIII bacterium]
MKKLWIAALVFVMVFASTACGLDILPGADRSDTGSSEARDTGSKDSVAEKTDEAKEDSTASENSDKVGGGGGGGQAMDSLISWMKSGTFSYDYKMLSEGGGQTTEAAGSMALDGDNIAIASEMTQGGQQIKSRIIIKDGTTYVIDDTNKFMIKIAGSGADMTGGLATDYSGIELVGSGTGEIDGKTLPYEEYTSEGVSVKYYMDGGKVYGFESEYEGYKTVMIITNASNRVPAGAFDLPTGYTEM